MLCCACVLTTAPPPRLAPQAGSASAEGRVEAMLDEMDAWLRRGHEAALAAKTSASKAWRCQDDNPAPPGPWHHPLLGVANLTLPCFRRLALACRCASSPFFDFSPGSWLLAPARACSQVCGARMLSDEPRSGGAHCAKQNKKVARRAL